MSWSSTRLAALGAFLLASIVMVIAAGQRHLDREKAFAELRYNGTEQMMLLPASYEPADRTSDGKSADQKRGTHLGLQPRFVRL